MKYKQLNDSHTSGQPSVNTAGKTELEWAIQAGITDGSRSGDYATREETVLMIAAALRYWTNCVFRLLNAESEEAEYI